MHRRAIATRWCGDDVRYAPTGKELSIAWDHGLEPGGPIGGPVFPQVLPGLREDEIEARMRGPVRPLPEIVRRNAELARAFEHVPL